MRGGGSGLGLGDGAVLDLTWRWHGRLVAGARSGLSWVGLVVVWLMGFFLLRVSGVRVSVCPHVCFVLGFVLISVFPGWCACGLGSSESAGRLGVWWPERCWGRGLVGRWLLGPATVISLLAVPRRHFCFVSSNASFWFNFLTRLIAVMSTVSTCLVCISSIVATCPPKPAARFVFSLCFICFVFFFAVVVSGEPKRKQWRGLIDHKLLQTPSNFQRRIFCFGSLVILDVARCYLWLFSLHLNMKIDNNSC